MAGATKSAPNSSLDVYDGDLDRSGSEGTLADGVPVAALAEVGGQRYDLDAHLLGHPAHRDRRVEPTAVGENDPLGHLFALLSSLLDVLAGHTGQLAGQSRAL